QILFEVVQVDQLFGGGGLFHAVWGAEELLIPAIYQYGNLTAGQDPGAAIYGESASVHTHVGGVTPARHPNHGALRLTDAKPLRRRGFHPILKSRRLGTLAKKEHILIIPVKHLKTFPKELVNSAPEPLNQIVACCMLMNP